MAGSEVRLDWQQGGEHRSTVSDFIKSLSAIASTSFGLKLKYLVSSRCRIAQNKEETPQSDEH